MKSLMRYLKNYKKESVIGPLFKLLEACFELIVPLVMAKIIDVGIKNNDTVYIFKMGGVLVLFGILGLACSLTAQFFAAKAAVGFGTELRHDLFCHIGQLSYSEIDLCGNATLITRMTSDINQVQSGVNLVLRLFLRSPFIVVGAMVLAFTISIKLAVIFLIAVPVLSIVIYGIMMLTIPLYKKVQKGLDQVLLSTRENLSGVRVVRAFCMQEKERDSFQNSNEQLMDLQLVVGKISALLNPVTYVIVNLSIIAILWFGGREVYIGTLTQGEVVALINYMSQILLALLALSNLIVAFTKAIASADRINDVFKLETNIKDGKEKYAEEEKEKSVKVEHVSFAYKGDKEPVLEDICLSVDKGETVGIIGGTGSGKTTLINLFPRFYEVSEGNIFINGRNVKDYVISDLRNVFGIVPQKAVLFHGTIRENMKYAKEDASDEEIIRALDIAQAEGELKNLDKKISEGGKNLSGGQKQRLTIARALVKDPQILIMDDSSSALDFATESKLRKQISKEAENRTVFIVSQRAASIMHADKIIVLENGKIAGCGKHDELLKKCGVYREICNSQLSGEGV